MYIEATRFSFDTFVLFIRRVGFYTIANLNLNFDFQNRLEANNKEHVQIPIVLTAFVERPVEALEGHNLTLEVRGCSSQTPQTPLPRMPSTTNQ